MTAARWGRPSGLALPILLVVMAVLLAVGAGLLGHAGAAGRSSRRELAAEQAFYAAEAGLQIMVARTRNLGGLSWSEAAPPHRFTDLCAGCLPAAVTVDWTCQDQDAQGRCTRALVTAEGAVGSGEPPTAYTLRAEIRYDYSSGQIQVRYVP